MEQILNCRNGLGENSVTIRSMVIEGISWFGCDVDPEKNFFGATGDISAEAAKVRVLVIRQMKS